MISYDNSFSSGTVCGVFDLGDVVLTGVIIYHSVRPFIVVLVIKCSLEACRDTDGIIRVVREWSYRRVSGREGWFESKQANL